MFESEVEAFNIHDFASEHPDLIEKFPRLVEEIKAHSDKPRTTTVMAVRRLTEAARDKRLKERNDG